MLMQLPQMASTLTLHSLSTNTFEQLTPVFLALAKMSSQEDYGVVGAEEDSVTMLTNLLQEFHDNTSE